MTLQNVRSLLWRGDDLGFGSGNSRELVLPSSTPAQGRPTLVTQAFVSSYVLPYVGATVALPSMATGKNRLIVNRNSQFWLTIYGFAAVAQGTTAGAVAVALPVPPLQVVFLPPNFVGPASVAANSAFPIPQPLVGGGVTTVPQATTQHSLTFDYVAEA